jgi:hypothetical protein
MQTHERTPRCGAIQGNESFFDFVGKTRQRSASAASSDTKQRGSGRRRYFEQSPE